MYTIARNLFLIGLILVGGLAAQAQTCPENLVCISQEAANRAAQNARELEATKTKVVVLEEAVSLKDASIEELKLTAKTNEAELRAALHRTEVKLAEITGEVTQLEAERVRWTAIIDVLVKNSRKKCMPFSVCF